MKTHESPRSRWRTARPLRECPLRSRAAYVGRARPAHVRAWHAEADPPAHFPWEMDRGIARCVPWACRTCCPNAAGIFPRRFASVTGPHTKTPIGHAHFRGSKKQQAARASAAARHFQHISERQCILMVRPEQSVAGRAGAGIQSNS